MKTFADADRYEYPLTPESIVLDCGAYEGNFARMMADRYGCNVYAFEPIRAFFENCQRTVAPCGPKVRLYNFGVGGTTRDEEFFVRRDSTRIFDDGTAHAKERAQIMDLLKFLDLILKKDAVIDLIKINIEGGEFELLERILDAYAISRFVNIQVQPHLAFPGAEQRWKAIQDRLRETHELVYYAAWCWEGWRRL